MRFENRLDDSDAVPERDGDIALPDDLAAMAEQLSDDAQRLAACYPPKFGPVREVAAAVASISPQRRPARRVVLAGSIFGGLVALGLLAALTLNMNRQQPVGGPDVSGTDAGQPSIAASSGPVDVRTEPLANSLIVPANSGDEAPPLTPPAWQRGVTGPEMEGWMDLAMDTESIEF
jgi:hypothetical protein